MKKDASLTWSQLRGKFDDEVITAPKTCGDPTTDNGAQTVDKKILWFLYHTVAGFPWANHFALLAAVALSRNLDVQTITNRLGILHKRFKGFFAELDLHSMDSWVPETYL